MDLSYFPLTPYFNETTQSTFTISTLNFSVSNTSVHTLQFRDPQTQLRNLLTDTLPYQSTGALFSAPLLSRHPLDNIDLVDPFLLQTSFGNELPMISPSNYLFQQSLESQLLSDLLELERRAIQSFEVLLESGLLEEHKEQGLNREQINNIEVSEFQEKPAEKDPVPRIKSRNGIHKRPKEDPKKVIKETMQKEKQEPTSSSTCAICLEDYKNKEKLRKLPCSHKFHKDCIDTWLSLKNNCPVCKGKPVEEPQQTPLNNMGPTPSLFNNSDIFQLFGSQGTLATPIPNTSTPNPLSQMPGRISNVPNTFNQLPNPSPVMMNNEGRNSASTTQNLNRQPRRVANRRAESNQQKKNW